MTTFTTLKRLSISWSVSKGRDTYGYNICRLDDPQTGKRFRTCGGGYDMIGQVLGQFVTETFQDDLMTTIKNNPLLTYYDVIDNNGVSSPQREGSLYGVYAYYKNGNLVKVSIDGACGVDTVKNILGVIGYDVESVYNRRKQCTDNFIITNKEFVL